MLVAKVAIGNRDWRPENVIGQLRLPGCGADPGLPDMGLPEARAAGAKTLVIGVANRGGVISQACKKVLVAALEEGFDLASGLHNRLRDESDLKAVAEATGRALHGARGPEMAYPITTRGKRGGKQRLAAGCDCSVGHIYRTMAKEREIHTRGMKAIFRATRAARHPDHRRRGGRSAWW